MSLIKMGEEQLGLDREMIINDHCPSIMGDRFISYDLASFASNKSNDKGCRGITCKACWDMEEVESEAFAKSYEEKRFLMYNNRDI